MNESNPQSLHPQLVAVLEKLRVMVRKVVVVDYVLTVLVILGLAFWGGLLLDYGPILLGGLEMPRSARTVLLLGLLALLAVLTVRQLIGRLSRKLPNESLALLLERQHPELGQRLLTSVQLGSAQQAGVETGSQHLFEHVRGEAANMSGSLDIRRVFQWKPLLHKAIIAGGLLLTVMILAIASPSTVGRAFGRLLTLTDDPWPRRAQLEMLGVEVPVVSFEPDDDSAPPRVELLPFSDGMLRLPKGTKARLRVRASSDKHDVPEVCTVYFDTASGVRVQANMRRVGSPRDGYQEFSLDGPPLEGITEDIALTVHGLDDRLSNYRVQAIDPPSVVNLQVECRYPPYLRDPTRNTDTPDLVVDYAPGLRIREGSDLTLVVRSNKTLSAARYMVQANDEPGIVHDAIVTGDGQSFTMPLANFTEDLSLWVLPVDEMKITATAPFRFYFGVVKDQAPSVSLNLVGIGSAITPVAKIPFRGQAEDDYELQRLEMAITPAQQAAEPPVLRNVSSERDGRFEGLVDLRDLVADDVMSQMTPGQRLNVYAEATDRYDLGARHTTQSDLFGLDVVSSDELLGRLERRELAMRARLEQTIDEIRQLRDVLDKVSKGDWQLPPAATSSLTAVALSNVQAKSDPGQRASALRELRIQQSSLQAAKSSDEIIGIAAGFGDIIAEMENNRVDSVDRRKRLTEQIKTPLEDVVANEWTELRETIAQLQAAVNNPVDGPQLAADAVDSAEDVLLRLNTVLESMLDLESYNEILDIVRDLIDRQDQLIDDTKDAQKRRVLNLFGPKE